MVTAVGGHPVTEGAFVDTELLCDSGDRARRVDHHLHGFLFELRREALLRSRQLISPFQTSILLDGLSEAFGAPHWALDELHVYRADGYSGASWSRPGLDRLTDA